MEINHWIQNSDILDILFWRKKSDSNDKDEQLEEKEANGSKVMDKTEEKEEKQSPENKNEDIDDLLVMSRN